MRIIVSDSSALIDLKKGGLLEVFMRLPWELIVPEDILADELLSFTWEEIAAMRRGMTAAVLNGVELQRVRELQQGVPALSIHDCTALIVAGRTAGAVLLTGDRRLREKATDAGIECHGVLWAAEAIAEAGLATGKTLLSALARWRADPLVRLPRAELEALARRLGR